MTTTTDAPADPVLDQARLDDLLGRVLADLAAGYGGATISLGDRLGLYEAMAGAGPISPAELAARSGCAERYLREWLNAQAAGGYVAYHPASGTYELTPEHRAVLADRDSPFFIPTAWKVPISMLMDEDRAVRAFRTGEGIAWGAHDHRLHEGVAGFYRNAYRASLVQEWIPALDGVEERLRAGARVADVGCGHGHSTVIMAEAFPASRFVGVDPHGPSIAAARAAAAAAGVDDRVTFLEAGAAGHGLADLDLVCFFDCFHDLGDPEGAAAAAAAALAPGGAVMLVEPYAGDRVEDNLNPVGRIYYAASTTVCCAHAIAEGRADPLGAQAGEARLADVCRRAGLTSVRRAAETPFNLILEARRG
jgi:SAM-dependent methyltransferase